MAPIVISVDVDSPPERAFAYVTDPTRFPEWQEGVVRGRLEGTGVGARCTTVRRIAGAEREARTEITAYDPPRRWADRGLDGPIRARVEVTVVPLDTGAGSRVTISVDFTGHGIGRLLVPLVVRRQAAREMPGNMERLRERLDEPSSHAERVP